MARTDTPPDGGQRGWRWLANTLFPTLRGVARAMTGAAQGPREHSEVRFEHSDVSSRAVILTGFGLLFAMWLAVFLLYYLYRDFQNYYYETSKPALPLARPVGSVPPEPRVQISPRTDLEQEVSYENAELQKYSWVDRQHGIVAIPIERAMQLIAQRGIPPQKAPPSLKLPVPEAGTRETGFEGKIAPEPR